VGQEQHETSQEGIAGRLSQVHRRHENEATRPSATTMATSNHCPDRLASFRADIKLLNGLVQMLKVFMEALSRADLLFCFRSFQ